MTTPRLLRRGALPVLAVAALCLGAATIGRAEEAPGDAPGKERAAEGDATLDPEALAYAEGIEESLVEAVAQVRTNTVAVVHLRRRAVPGAAEPVLARYACGSGVVIRRKGQIWILTNVHVVAGHHGLQVVTCDGVTHDAVLHDMIREYDIALLRFAEKPGNRDVRGVEVRGRNSERGLKEGTLVLATGNPFWLGIDGACVATLGVISGMDRYLGGEYQYVGALQHDAEVNPGNSGGPLWTLEGDLIGINGKIATSHAGPGGQATNSGAAFSLPIHQVDAFLRQLIDEDAARAGFLGLMTETATDDRGKAYGARVVAVHPRSPLMSDRDRPEPGDIVLRLYVGGRSKRIYTASDLQQEVSLLQAGTDISLAYKNGSRTRRWKGTLLDEPR